MQDLTIHVPRILVGGTSGGIGKSVFMTGLIVALRKRGMSVSCCVTGPALHQAVIYSRLTRRHSHTLDRRILDTEQVIATVVEAERGADIVLIDGSQGFYDGISLGDLHLSDADIANCTETPVLLVMRAPFFSDSLCAMVRGFSQFSQTDLIKGLVANGLRSPSDVGTSATNPTVESVNRHMHHNGLPTFVGSLPSARFAAKLPAIAYNQRENLTILPRELFLDIAEAVTPNIDVDEILSIAALAPPLIPAQQDRLVRQNVCRIAVSDDACFDVAYQDNLAWLSRYGAEIVSFSPLSDTELPRNIKGLYLTGAYLDQYGEELSQNTLIRASIRDFALQGGLVYSEGAGTAYICSSYQAAAGQESYPGVGLITGEAVRASNPQGSLKAVLVEDSILGAAGCEIRGLSMGDWGLRVGATGSSGALIHTARMAVEGGLPFNEGLSPTPQALSTFNFLHFGSNQTVARTFVDAAVAAVLSPN